MGSKMALISNGIAFYVDRVIPTSILDGIAEGICFGRKTWDNKSLLFAPALIWLDSSRMRTEVDGRS